MTRKNGKDLERDAERFLALRCVSHVFGHLRTRVSDRAIWGLPRGLHRPGEGKRDAHEGGVVGRERACFSQP